MSAPRTGHRTAWQNWMPALEVWEGFAFKGTLQQSRFIGALVLVFLVWPGSGNLGLPPGSYGHHNNGAYKNKQRQYAANAQRLHDGYSVLAGGRIVLIDTVQKNLV